MKKRPEDQIVVITDDGEFDAYESVTMERDFNEVANCTFTFGDDDTWNDVAAMVAPGGDCKVVLNGTLLFDGRFESNSAPTNPTEGTKVSLVARTKLSDARVGSADPSISFKNTTVKAFIYKLFAPLGYKPEDFITNTFVDRDLVTGKQTGQRDFFDFEKPKADQLKVNPPETIHNTATRVLKWYHAMIWDGADGTIIIGKPDDSQDATYQFVCLRSPEGSIANNVLSIHPSIDWSEGTAQMLVFGKGAGKDVFKAKTRGLATRPEIVDVANKTGHFNRTVIKQMDGASDPGRAQAEAMRELASRSKKLKAWEVDVDGWSWWDGEQLIAYDTNTTASIFSDAHFDISGIYLINKLSQRFTTEGHATTKINMLAQGLYDV
jgi:prophage tail gpP-like protein